MKRIKTGLTGFILGDWLGMPYRGKGKGTFKPIWTKSYLRGDKCSGNTSMLLCALDSRCNLELYQQNLRNWYFKAAMILMSASPGLGSGMGILTQETCQGSAKRIALISDMRLTSYSQLICYFLSLL